MPAPAPAPAPRPRRRAAPGGVGVAARGSESEVATTAERNPWTVRRDGRTVPLCLLKEAVVTGAAVPTGVNSWSFRPRSVLTAEAGAREEEEKKEEEEEEQETSVAAVPAGCWRSMPATGAPKLAARDLTDAGANGSGLGGSRLLFWLALFCLLPSDDAEVLNKEE